MSRSRPDAPRHGALRAFVRARLGPGVSLADASREVGRQSVVWRATSPDGAIHYLKQPESPKLYRRERDAYLRWTPRLAPVRGTHVPRLVAHDDGLGALLVTALPDATSVDALPRGDPRRAGAFERAGALLRALHGLDVGPAPFDAVARMRDLIPRYVEPAREHVDPATHAWALWMLDEGRPFAGAPVGACHRDWSPRNWVVAGDASAPTVSVFDWERAEVDVQWSDMNRMAYDDWHLEPALREAFLRGYGRSLDAEASRQLDLYVLLNAMASIAWAAEREDREFEVLSRRVLARLRETLDA